MFKNLSLDTEVSGRNCCDILSDQRSIEEILVFSELFWDLVYDRNRCGLSEEIGLFQSLQDQVLRSEEGIAYLEAHPILKQRLADRFEKLGRTPLIDNRDDLKNF